MADQASEIRHALIDIDLLKPHPRNYQGHSDEQLQQLRASLRQFGGQVRSIVVWEQPGGWYFIIAGHGVTQAARLEGFRSMKADVLPAHWSEARALAYLAADNELARLADPDEAQLAELAAWLKNEGEAELAALAAGSEKRLKELLKSLDEGNDGGDPGPQVERADELREKWGTAEGQVWGLGAFTRCPKCGKRHELPGSGGGA
jgi:ParB-like chromosome segregation protein Spo0J